jgi:hypothetical protein
LSAVLPLLSFERIGALVVAILVSLIATGALKSEPHVFGLTGRSAKAILVLLAFASVVLVLAAVDYVSHTD